LFLYFRDHFRVLGASMPFSVVFKLLPITLAFLCFGCKTQQIIVEQPSSVAAAPAQATKLPKRKSLADKLLERAESRFTSGRLFEPAESNAYDLYRAVQTIEPENKYAEAGLQAILLSEVGKAEQALQKSRFKQAERMQKRLARLFPEYDRVTKLKKDIAAAKSVKPAVLRSSAPTPLKPERERISLDEIAVRKKAPELVEQLDTLAHRLELSREGVLIYARSDAQGRWVYQQMRKAVPNYRIRGDLRIGKPSIVLLPPFEGE